MSEELKSTVGSNEPDETAATAEHVENVEPTDEIIKIGAKASEDVECANCKKMFPGAEAHCFRGNDGEDIYFCSECKKEIDVALAEETQNPNYFGAVALGLIAGAVAGLVWYLIEIFSGYQIGYVAIGAGYLIGWAVVLGSGKKRGSVLQVISTLIAVVSIYGAAYFSAIHSVNKYLAEEAAKQGANAMAYLWVSPFHPDLLKMMVSPVGLLIWGFAFYIAFKTPQARKM